MPSTPDRPWRASARGFALVVIVALASPILAHIYNGQFTRMMADDYCLANVAIQRGLTGSLHQWYTEWTGTPSSIVGQSAVGLLGPGANALLPPLTLVLISGAAIWALYQLAALLQVRYPRSTALTLGSLITFGVVVGLPNVHQALYWTSGTVVYAVPLIFGWLLIGVIAHALRQHYTDRRLWLTGVICGVVTFIIGGFTQTVVAMQTAGLLLALGMCWRFLPAHKQRATLILLSASLAGSLLALVVTLAAPGNAVRLAAHPAPHSLIETAWITIQNTAAFAAMQLAIFAPLPLFLCLLLPALGVYWLQPIALQNRSSFKQTLLLMALVAGIGLALIAAFLAPAAYGMGQMPASRAWIVPQTILVVVSVGWGILIGLSFPPHNEKRLAGVITAAGLMLLVFTSVQTTLSTLSTSANLRAYAADWDARHAMLQAASRNGTQAINVPAYRVDMADYANLDRIDNNPANGYTGCMEQYYGIPNVTISASSDAPAS